MIDWVLLQRIRRALDHRQKLDPDINDVTTRADYYRELVWLGYTPTVIAIALGWNTKRIQAELQQRNEPRTPPPHHTAHTDPPLRTLANDVLVDTTPEAVQLTIDGTHYAITGTPEQLLTLGRLFYGAAASHHQEQTA